MNKIQTNIIPSANKPYIVNVSDTVDNARVASDNNIHMHTIVNRMQKSSLRVCGLWICLLSARNMMSIYLRGIELTM